MKRFLAILMLVASLANAGALTTGGNINQWTVGRLTSTNELNLGVHLFDALGNTTPVFSCVNCSGAGAGTTSVTVVNPLPAGTNTIGNTTILDNTGNSIAGVTVNGARRLDVNLASESLSGTSATGYVAVVGGIDGSGITQPLQFDANKNVKVSVTPTAQNLFWPRVDAFFASGNNISGTAGGGMLYGPNGLANNSALIPLYVIPVSPAANTSLGNYNTEGTKQSYYASVTGVAISALTDFFTITGSGSKTIRVTKIRLSGIATAASAANVTALIRSTADTAGTSFTATDVAADSSNAAGTAVVKAYTASPTLGTLVGFVDSVYQTFTTSAGAIPNVPLEMAYGTRNAQSAVLRGTTQQLCLSLNGATVTGLTVNVAVEWTEE